MAISLLGAIALKFLTPRKPDGHGNDGDFNPSNDEGVHDSAFVRITPNSYVDGIGSLPGQSPGTLGAIGANLPAPRAVSNAVLAAGTTDIPNSFGVNEFFQFFGQILTHDMAEAATGASGDAPIFLAALFPFGRTPYEDGTAETGPRQQINEETSFLDLSMVYGNNQDMLDLVRADLRDKNGNVQLDQQGNPIQSAKLLMGADNMFPTIKEVGIDAGLTSLQVLALYRPDGFGGLPNPAGNPDPATFENLYVAGDNRVNQTPLLISQQLIWAREHNYQVDKLTPYAKLLGWSQDQLFEAARAITEAEWQHVVYDEYLPKLLGQNALTSYKGYKSSVDPSIINEFTTVAFRFGHDQSSQNQKPIDENGAAVNPDASFFSLFTLAEAFTAGADGARTSENIDQWVRGMLASYTQEIDGLVVDGNRNTLFNIGGGAVTIDLEVFDIMRARDHGVWNYNDLREGMGFSAYTSFDQFGAANGIDAARLASLKAVYGDNIDMLDSLVGGLLEKKYLDSQLGETFTKIIAIQFQNLRDGDRLFYENRFKSMPGVLAEIDGTSMTDILKRTTGVDYLYRDAFLAHNRISENDGSIAGTTKADLVIGTNLGEIIKAGDGNDDVYAGKGNDFIFGGKGVDWLWGGAGKDVFAFEKMSGRDVVKDFDTKNDRLDLTDYGIDTWKEAKKAMTKTATGVTIKLDAQNSVELVGVKLASMTTKNFIYDDDFHYPAV